jgi:DNA-binding transcriptional regulator YiaG
MTAPLVSSLFSRTNTTCYAEKSFRSVKFAEEFKARFSERWAAFLRSEFQSAEHIGRVFGVTSRTADNWRTEVSKPSGDTIALFFLRYPEAVAFFMND